ncbi:MAG: prephenate dehydrogenase [Chloroflexi bacterium]|nr:prephenate dehydrogenase [Chloroflexota bacterium]
MARIGFERVTIVGTGMLGASLGLALKRLTPAPHVVGCDLSGDARREAMRVRAVDRATGNIVDAVREADLVVVATPVRATELVFREIAPLLRTGTVVTDTGSTKRQVLAWAAEHLPETVSFVGGHPMTGKATAGTTGPSADVFVNAVYCISSPTSAEAKAVERIVNLAEAIGSVPYFVEPDEHDGLVASVSHLPYVVSAALMRAASTDRGWREAKTIAAGGFATATHLTEGDPRMWADICLTNGDQIARQIDRLIDELSDLRAALEQHDERLFDRFSEVQNAHAEWLIGRTPAEEAPAFNTADLKPQSLFFPGKLGELLRRGDKEKR